MTTFLTFFGSLIDIVNKLWDISPIGFVLFVVCIPIVLVWAYAIIRDTFDPYYGYPKEYREAMKSRSNKS